MADLKLNRIATAIEKVERIDEFRITACEYLSNEDLFISYDHISSNLFYMKRFGIISEQEYKQKRERLSNWFLNYDLSL